MPDLVLSHEVPHRAVTAIALGANDPRQVLLTFDYNEEQITWLLNDPEFARIVEARRVELEKTGATDAARVRAHAIAQMELCTRRSVAGMLREVDVKYLDVLLRGSALGQKAAEGPVGPAFSIKFVINQGNKGTTIDVTPTELSAFAQIELPTEEFS